jgi:hypothetical protein
MQEIICTASQIQTKISGIEKLIKFWTYIWTKNYKHVIYIKFWVSIFIINECYCFMNNSLDMKKIIESKIEVKINLVERSIFSNL